MNKLIREFDKFFTREFPIFNIEYWWKGEYHGLKNITHGLMQFNPLFIYNGKAGVGVYYDMNNPYTDDDLLLEYFEKNPNEYQPLEDQYMKDCVSIEELSKNPSWEDFDKLYKLAKNIWPFIAVTVVLSRKKDKCKIKELANQAYQVRIKTDKIEYLVSKILHKLIEQKYNITKQDAGFLLYDEIIDGNIDKSEIEKRKKGFIYFEGKLFSDITLDKFTEMNSIKILDNENQDKDMKELKGSTAMKGKVRGNVKVVLNLDELDKVEQGDILVAAMTTPDYAPALNKAVAIITDEGGIACHAAIVAREMKIPAVIGTKNATEILKDNMEVEVDADKGVVNIIKNV